MWIVAIVLTALAVMPALAAPRIDAVAAGDPTDTSIVLWTRAADDDRPATVRAEVATDPGFTRIVRRVALRTAPDDDFTAKVVLDGLRPGTRYHYRFCALRCDPADVGRFSTAPAADAKVRLRFGFTGDADGKYRPYPAAADIADRDLDFFVFLGDTMYESAATGSPATASLSPDADPESSARALRDTMRKYRENIQGVTPNGAADPSGFQGLKRMRQATGHYTTLDNHELGSGALAAGGASPRAAGGNKDLALDINPDGPFNNKTLAFQALTRAFYAYHPTRVSITGTEGRVSGPMVVIPSDPRSHGTPRNWFAQTWGANAIYIQTDGRTYRDARLMLPDAPRPQPGADDTGPRADNPGRTMLGRTQLAWLKATLLAAQQAGITWKFVTVSSPLDHVGKAIPVEGSRWPALGTQYQDGKSWVGGYRAERNDLLGFIVANGIRNVVFLTTDDHFVRVTTLHYQGPDGAMRPVPGAIHIVSGPIGAGGPDAFLPTSQDKVEQALARRQRMLSETGAPSTGLPADFPGLTVTQRRFGAAGGPPRPLDFYLPDVFAYTTLQVDPDGTLVVDTFGIVAYPPNRYPQDRPASAHMMGFRIAPR